MYLQVRNGDADVELKPLLCDNQGGGKEWEVGGRFQWKGKYVYLWLIRVDVWQKPTQFCKVIIIQLKINKFLKKLSKK